MTAYTEHEAEAIRYGVNNALDTMLNADKEGFFAPLKESRAWAKALEQLPEPLRSIVTNEGFGPEDFDYPEDPSIAAGLRLSVDTINARTPELLDAFKAAVLQAAHDAAEAAKGTSEAEAAVIEEIRAALEG